MDTGRIEEHAIMSMQSVCGEIGMMLNKIELYMTCPSAIYKPKIYIDGDKWCALYGENIQDGVCGFGDTPEKAMHEFDRNWQSFACQPKNITRDKKVNK